MANIHTAEKYPSWVNGVKKTLTVPEWVEYLADKPIYEHRFAQNIYNLLRDREKNGQSISQCLGILEPDLKLVAGNKDKQVFLEIGMQAKYDKVNALVRKMCLRTI